MLLGGLFILLLAVGFGVALWRFGAPGDGVEAKPRPSCCSLPHGDHASVKAGMHQSGGQCH